MRRLGLFLACQHFNSGMNVVSARIRAGSRFKRILCFVLIDVRCSRVVQVEDHWFSGLLINRSLDPIKITESRFCRYEQRTDSGRYFVLQYSSGG
jgi:hypothetical protein